MAGRQMITSPNATTAAGSPATPGGTYGHGQQGSMYYYGSAVSVAPNNGNNGTTVGGANNGGWNPNQPIRIGAASYMAASEALRRRIVRFLIGSLLCSVAWLISLLGMYALYDLTKYVIME
jgi:hypothetical protein